MVSIGHHCYSRGVESVVRQALGTYGFFLIHKRLGARVGNLPEVSFCPNVWYVPPMNMCSWKAVVGVERPTFFTSFSFSMVALMARLIDVIDPGLVAFARQGVIALPVF